jgi:regulator of replication initiation timing
MNTEQIIKALADAIALGIKYPRVDAHLLIDALELIKEQLGKIKGPNSALDALRDVAKDYENHSENLQKENKYLRERLAEEMEHKEDMVVVRTARSGGKAAQLNKVIHIKKDEIIADTVKKMQAEIEARCIKGGIYPAFVARTIDQIAKEMLEGEK